MKILQGIISSITYYFHCPVVTCLRIEICDPRPQQRLLVVPVTLLPRDLQAAVCEAVQVLLLHSTNGAARALSVGLVVGPWAEAVVHCTQIYGSGRAWAPVV